MNIKGVIKYLEYCCIKYPELQEDEIHINIESPKNLSNTLCDIDCKTKSAIYVRGDYFIIERRTRKIEKII